MSRQWTADEMADISRAMQKKIWHPEHDRPIKDRMAEWKKNHNTDKRSKK